jgi:hypothetical protein
MHQLLFTKGYCNCKAIKDKHPRTSMCYTKDNKSIILVVEDGNPNAGGDSKSRACCFYY